MTHFAYEFFQILWKNSNFTLFKSDNLVKIFDNIFSHRLSCRIFHCNTVKTLIIVIRIDVLSQVQSNTPPWGNYLYFVVITLEMQHKNCFVRYYYLLMKCFALLFPGESRNNPPIIPRRNGPDPIGIAGRIRWSMAQRSLMEWNRVELSCSSRLSVCLSVWMHRSEQQHQQRYPHDYQIIFCFN